LCDTSPSARLDSQPHQHHRTSYGLPDANMTRTAHVYV